LLKKQFGRHYQVGGKNEQNEATKGGGAFRRARWGKKARSEALNLNWTAQLRRGTVEQRSN